MLNETNLKTVLSNFEQQKQELEQRKSREFLRELRYSVKREKLNLSRHEIRIFAGMGASGLIINDVLYSDIEHYQWRKPENKLLKFLRDLNDVVTLENYYDLIVWLDGEKLN